jgi:hypothetical protein
MTRGVDGDPVKRQRVVIAVAALVVLALLLPGGVSAHNVSKRDATFVGSNTGRAIVPFLYLGPKHMVTGYDHFAVSGRRHLFPLQTVRQPFHARTQRDAAFGGLGPVNYWLVQAHRRVSDREYRSPDAWRVTPGWV